MKTKLDSTQQHLLQLVVKDSDAEGWTPVSRACFPLVEQLPTELVNLETVGEEGRGRVRLTEEGRNLMAALQWV